ncbi:Hypoxanthine phosphoribosyltransferase [bioreactor metagenome]|uniref:hypoxanthine phosphoribosyltransferase n=1 Tax=bioreactor metagenome TaxID=1076179 RepID=A0A645BZV2_9ZZZZ
MAVCILKGSLVFVADLIREIKLPLEVSFLRATSYGSGTVSSGVVEISLAIDEKDLIGADVLVVEDILDSGHTLSNILKYLAGKGAHSVSLCVLLNKPSRRKTEVTIDYEGKQIPDEFVVGYGLDYNEKYRNLPYIGVLKKELYS